MAPDWRPGWRIVAATRRGEGHARRGERGQDALRVRLAADGRTVIAAVADGAGSAPRGGVGAALAARAAAAAACATLDGGRAAAGLDEGDAAAWVGAARARIEAAAGRRGLPLRDFAATLIVAVSDGAATLVAHVGDGAAVARDEAGGWRALSWPEAGEHAGETRFVTDDALALRTARDEGPATALALFTDGLERLVLDFAARAPHAPFFERMTAPLGGLAAPGRDAGLSRALGRWLGGPAVAARTDDDRTLALALLAARP